MSHHILASFLDIYTTHFTFSSSSIWTNSKIFSIILIHSFATIRSTVPSNTRGFLSMNLSEAGFNPGATARGSYWGCGGCSLTSGPTCSTIGPARLSPWGTENLCINASNNWFWRCVSSSSLLLASSAYFYINSACCCTTCLNSAISVAVASWGWFSFLAWASVALDWPLVYLLRGDITFYQWTGVCLFL